MAPPALSQVQEFVSTDERLLQLKLQAQDHIVRSKGCCQGSAAGLKVIDSGLVASLARNAAYSIQQGLPASGANTVATAPSQSTDVAMAGNSQQEAVMALLQQQWQQLITERLNAAQMLLPDVPLATTPRTEQDLASLRSQAGEALEAWERIGCHQSPFTSSFQAPSVSKLLYDAEDLLQAINTVVTIQQTSVPVSTVSKVDTASASIGGNGGSTDISTAQPQQQQQLPVQLTLLQAVRAPNRAWLQSFFADLTAHRRQVGVDDVLHSWFKQQQVDQARKSAASCSAAACRAAARTGLPPSERPWVWATALGLHAAPPARVTRTNSSTAPSSTPPMHFQPPASVAAGDDRTSEVLQGSASALQAACEAASSSFSDWWRLPCQRDRQVLQLLCESVEKQVLLTDVLTCADVQRLADNEHYFVFEEPMRAILLAFSRDPSVSTTAAVPAAPRLAAEIKGGQQLRPYPASGILPFQGLASFLAPVCFMYQHPAAVYKVFMAMYCRFWSRLHTLNINPAPAAGLPVLCRTFLELLQDVDPDVFQQLCRLTATPLDLAMPWIMSGFVGYLAPSETLLLWDRIIGFDSLLVLPVLAVAIMTFRRDLVLTAQSSDELLEVLEDLSQIRVVPLLQALLFDS